VLLVHRPRYDDWSLPKGKLHPDERAGEGALREVEEETGYRCELRWELAETRYRDSRGRDKRVRYFAMRPLGGEFSPGGEVDEIRWVAPGATAELLSYPRDAAVVAAFGYDGREHLLLVRHASAGERKRWQGDDRLRPLDERGRRQAERLVDVLAGHFAERILTSPYVRCVQTVEPLARRRGLAIEEREELAEGAGLDAFLGLELRAAAVSVHGDLVEELLGEARRKGSTTLLEGLEPLVTIPPPA
jgi:8-oxo-(d)GTP phosphatase